MTIPELERHLTALRLPGIRTTLTARILEADQGMPFLEVFVQLIQDELDARRSRQRERRLQCSGLNEHKSMVDFDWSFNPKLPKKEIMRLIATQFIRDGEDALLIGSPGTGKSHIAQAVALAAIDVGFKVIYREASAFFQDLFEASQLGLRQKTNKLFGDTDLLVIDDLFLRKIHDSQAADDLLDIILMRYAGRKSTLITSNRPLEDWGPLLRDQAAASAILDRLLHRGNLLEFEGRSYRLKEASARLLARSAQGAKKRGEEKKMT